MAFYLFILCHQPAMRQRFEFGQLKISKSVCFSSFWFILFNSHRQMSNRIGSIHTTDVRHVMFMWKQTWFCFLLSAPTEKFYFRFTTVFVRSQMCIITLSLFLIPCFLLRIVIEDKRLMTIMKFIHNRINRCHNRIYFVRMYTNKKKKQKSESNVLFN